jgi:Transposase DDE domain
MSHSQQLYHTVFCRLREGIPQQRITRVRNVALLVTALYLAGSCALTRVADHLLIRGCKDSRVQRIRRLLMNGRLAVRTCYQSTATAILRHMGTARIVLILDRTTLGNWLNILTVSVAYRGRALPLAWRVFKKQGQFRRHHVAALLRWVRTCLPETVKPNQIWVVGDREFQDVALQATVEQDLGWHYVQRTTHNLWLVPQDGEPFKPNQIAVQPGQTYSRADVRVTQKHAGPAFFVAYWAIGEREPWYLLSDQPSSLQTLHVYRRRFWTEPMYRDFKSYGWQLEASRLRDPKRLERLLLGIALAYVWLMQLASAVMKRGGRRLVDRTARRTLSYFRIGWNWLLWRLDRDLPIELPDLLYI